MLKRNGYRLREEHSIMTVSKSKKTITIIFVIILAVILLALLRNRRKENTPVTKTTIIHAQPGEIKEVISCTGTVEPRNRLEIKPTISGRIDRILVKEGDKVRAGDILIWMSSEERAALIDAARVKGSSSVQYWEEAYKPIPIIAPISGTIIVRDIEPGQSVTSVSTILVISDRLIVRASVDETDIGKVISNQKAAITLDAYPDVSATGRVSHISYESTIINNVTTYEVDIIPDTVPAVFRSGMTANIEIVRSHKKNILTLPASAIQRKNGRAIVLVRSQSPDKPETKEIKTGITDGALTEIISGLDTSTPVIMESQSFTLPDEDQASSPFFPGRRERKKK